jgi:hypothetical protein
MPAMMIEPQVPGPHPLFHGSKRGFKPRSPPNRKKETKKKDWIDNHKSAKAKRGHSDGVGVRMIRGVLRSKENVLDEVHPVVSYLLV